MSFPFISISLSNFEPGSDLSFDQYFIAWSQFDPLGFQFCPFGFSGGPPGPLVPREPFGPGQPHWTSMILKGAKSFHGGAMGMAEQPIQKIDMATMGLSPVGVHRCSEILQ